MNTPPRILSLQPEPMTAAGFAPFGTLLEPASRPAAERSMTPLAYRCDGQTTVTTIWQPAAATTFSRLERHFAVTQTFVQLSGSPAVVCVAPPTDLDDAQAIPQPGEVRAFLIDPGVGWSFHVGTWHSLDRYVLTPPGATFLMLNVEPNPTQMVDYASGESLHFANLDSTPPRSRQLAGDFGWQFRIEPPGA